MELLLFAGARSTSAAETVATLEAVPVEEGRTTMRSGTLAPAASVPTLQVTVAPDAAHPGDAQMSAAADGNVALTTTPVAAMAAWLVAVSVRMRSLRALA